MRRIFVLIFIVLCMLCLSYGFRIRKRNKNKVAKDEAAVLKKAQITKQKHLKKLIDTHLVGYKPMPVGYLRQTHAMKPYASSLFFVPVLSGQSVTVSFEVMLDNPFNYTVIAKEDKAPTDKVNDYKNNTKIIIPSKLNDRSVYFVIKNTGNSINNISVQASPNINIFTPQTMQQVYNKTLAAKSLLMSVFQVNFESGLNHEEMGIAGFMNKFDDLFVSAFDTALFLRPYMRYYTFFTVSESGMKFQDLNITQEAQPYVLDMIKGLNETTVSPFGDLFLRELNVSRINFTRSSRSGKFRLCAQDYNAENLLYTGFSCYNLHNGNIRGVTVPGLMIFSDIAYYLFQFAATFAIVSYVSFTVNMIRKGKTFVYVTDSIRNPPFWQCACSIIPVKYMANFRIWECLLLLVVHLVISGFSILSELIPNDWPSSDDDNDIPEYASQRRGYIAVMCVTVAINTVFLLVKIFKNYKHHRMIRLHAHSERKYDIAIRVVLATIVSLIFLPILSVFVMELLPNTYEGSIGGQYRLALWWLFAIGFSIGNIVYLSTMEVWVVRNSLSERFVIAHIFLDYMAEAAFYVFQTLNAFAATFIITRFIQSSIMNVLMNLSVAPKYGYALSIIITLYKFYGDVKAPYGKLKALICKNRKPAHFKDILADRDELQAMEADQILKSVQLRKDPSYPIPMTWHVFFRIAKLMRISMFTTTTIVNCAVLLFVLCMVFTAIQTFEASFLGSVGNAGMIAVVAGSIMPLIPQILDTAAATENNVSSPVFEARLESALKLLESKEEARNVTQFKVEIPNKLLPFKYAVVSAFLEDKNERIDPIFDYNRETFLPIPLKDANTKEQNEQEITDNDAQSLLFKI
ncbi:hypothetical protein AKO1_006889 [Acrasis kona]|uniref:Uncharacterized protein n=1 Tax=Acrasis kona TaxID=1008807 RepID=A0AAW2YT94_9EUKA